MLELETLEFFSFDLDEVRQNGVNFEEGLNFMSLAIVLVERAELLIIKAELSKPLFNWISILVKSGAVLLNFL